jgi:hypothetical protein
LSFALDGKLGLFIPPRKNPAGSGAEGDVFAQVLPQAGFCYPQLLVFHPVV